MVSIGYFSGKYVGGTVALILLSLADTQDEREKRFAEAPVTADSDEQGL
ncbi:MAG: hypothetical protein ACFB21_12610 [Opitutales bacterium]